MEQIIFASKKGIARLTVWLFSHTASCEIPHLFGTYSFIKSMSLVPNLNQMNLVHSLHYFFHIFQPKLCMCAIRPVCFIIFYFIVVMICNEEQKLRRLSLCTCLKPPITSSLLVPVILLSPHFWNMFKLCFSLSDRNPFRTRGTIIILYILIVTLLDRRQEDKSYELNGGKCSSDLICP